MVVVGGVGEVGGAGEGGGAGEEEGGEGGEGEMHFGGGWLWVWEVGFGGLKRVNGVE